MLAILNGKVLPTEEAMVPATDVGLLRGDGVFEVIRVYNGVPFALEEHFDRMERSAANLQVQFDRAAIESDTADLLASTPDHDGCLRLVSTGGGTRIGFLEALPPIPPSIKLTTLPYHSTILLDGVKSLSYAANMLATRIAVGRGAGESLLVTEGGTVLEGPRQSFVCSIDGERLITPPLSDRVLDSITRRTLLATGLLDERSIHVDEIPQMKEAFLASTLREVHPVSAIDDVELPAPGPLSQAIDTVLRATIAEAVGGSA
ncbi:MAG: hypothetical protein F2813_00695 [Actinobacteria bacterium]|uniref:Unannotated protein n=1 Tax=freshwater metagenome TaxID=449393 RepID=A0A6J5Z1C8_9ZZZZ|nr:hypothetical protein [Actinomycetota bacterium]